MRALQATADNMGARAKEMDMILFFTRVPANFLDELARKRLLRSYIGA